MMEKIEDAVAARERALRVATESPFRLGPEAARPPGWAAPGDGREEEELIMSATHFFSAVRRFANCSGGPCSVVSAPQIKKNEYNIILEMNKSGRRRGAGRRTGRGRRAENRGSWLRSTESISSFDFFGMRSNFPVAQNSYSFSGREDRRFRVKQTNRIYD